MSKDQDRMISKRSDGKWANKRNDASRASTLHNTQRDAIDAARRMLGNQGGGEMSIQRAKGGIRAKDTVSPGRDPNPPRDKR
ncbi:DUF2188 domain-containing protein [Salinarimonas sp. NSM]|uniref:DUF2188 domain-containing protein n=1 Tax=Salinarimonas sp. NSM TaxID=3458003 RepID=UPI0040359933